jgi:osmotically inducible protein OsmC
MGHLWDHRSTGRPRSPAWPIPLETTHQTEDTQHMATTRQATATWSGDLISGNGTVTAGTPGIFRDLPTTWASRTGEPAGITSPEELLAAAHASCFSMAFSNILAKAGTPPTRVAVEVSVAADKLDSGFTVLRSDIVVRGTAPGATQESFAAAASEAKDGCPISKALKGNIAMSVEATLEV